MNRYLPLVPTLGIITLSTLVSQPVLALERSQIAAQAEEITVRIEGEETTGTGTIIKQDGDRYTVLTCWHVANAEGTFEITTVDGEVYQATEVKNLDNDFDAVLQRNSNNASLFFKRGYAYEQLGESERAIADLDEAIRLDPEYANAYINRGVSYRDLGEYEKAIADYNEAIRLDPEYAFAFYNRGISYYDLGDRERAIDSFQQAADLYQQQGKTEDYQDALDRLGDLQ